MDAKQFSRIYGDSIGIQMQETAETTCRGRYQPISGAAWQPSRCFHGKEDKESFFFFFFFL
jgi:hypothetical protein